MPGPRVVTRPAGYSDTDSDSDSEFEISGEVFNLLKKKKIALQLKSSTSGTNQGNLLGDDQDENWLEECIPLATPAKLLEQAIIKKDVELATELFYQKNVTINQYLDNGWTVLLHAANVACPELVDLFLKAGADVGQSTPEGYTCLMAVTNRSNDVADALKIVKLLVHAEANVNACNIHGLTPLMFAVKEKRVDLIRAFLDVGAIIDRQDTSGRTALIIASELGFGREARALLERNANIHLVTGQGMSAYDSALQSKYEKLAEMLLLVESTCWRPGLNPALMQKPNDISTRNRFQDIRQLQARTVEHSQIDMTLERLGLDQYKEAFRAHELQYIDFIRLTEEDLKDIGMKNVKERKLVLEAIHDILDREWANATVLPVHLQKKISAAESVCMLVSINKHLEFLGTSMKWMVSRTRADPRMLEYGIEINSISDLIRASEKTMAAADDFTGDIIQLKKTLLSIDGGVGLDRTNDIRGQVVNNKLWRWAIGCSFVTLAGFLMFRHFKINVSKTWFLLFSPSRFSSNIA